MYVLMMGKTIDFTHAFSQMYQDSNGQIITFRKKKSANVVAVELMNKTIKDQDGTIRPMWHNVCVLETVNCYYQPYKKASTQVHDSVVEAV